jgi:hypothetical protein
MEHDESIDFLNDKTPMDSALTERYTMRRVQPKFLIPDSPHEDAECTVDYTKVMDEVARRADGAGWLCFSFHTVDPHFLQRNRS